MSEGWQHVVQIRHSGRAEAEFALFRSALFCMYLQGL